MLKSLFSLLSSRKFIAFVALVIIFKIYQKLKKKDENKLIYKNKTLPNVGTVIGHVSSLHIYPIKSCKAISIKSSKMDINGLLYDRLIMAINSKLTPIKQMIIPKLALIKVEIISNDDDDDIIFSLSLPEQYNLEKLYLNLKWIETSNTRSNTIDLHGVTAKCKDCGSNAAEWLNTALTKITGKTKKNYRFVMIINGETRKIKDSLVRDLVDDCKSYDSTRLHNLAPIHLVSTASLNALNERIPSSKPKIPINRFRANIVFKPINDNYAFLEDHISMLQIGTLQLRIISSCFRCMMPSINQENGETEFFKSRKTCEPFNTLRRTRLSSRYIVDDGILPPHMTDSKGLTSLFGLDLGFTSSQLMDIENMVIKQGDKVVVLKYRKDNDGVINQLFMKIAQYFGLNTLQ